VLVATTFKPDDMYFANQPQHPNTTFHGQVRTLDFIDTVDDSSNSNNNNGMNGTGTRGEWIQRHEAMVQVSWTLDEFFRHEIFLSGDGSYLAARFGNALFHEGDDDKDEQLEGDVVVAGSAEKIRVFFDQNS
jgi:hypothetical protein